MNTTPPLAPTPDPTTPGASAAPTALSGALTTVIAGTPLAVVTVWALETWGSVHGQPIKLDGTTASAVGAVGAGLLTYLVQVLRGLFTLATDKLTEPK